MAIHTYDSVTGPITIEVDPQWAAMLHLEDEALLRNNRKHSRSDHKYAPGTPLSLERLFLEGKWFEDRNCLIKAAELSLDLISAMKSLTALQVRYFILARIYDYDYVAIGKLVGKHSTTIQRLVESAMKKLNKILADYTAFDSCTAIR